MRISRVRAACWLISGLVLCLGCQQKTAQDVGRVDLNSIVFLSDTEGEEPDFLVFPACNGTGKLSNPYRSHYLGIRVISVEVDGKPIPPEPCGVYFDDLDMRHMEIGPNECFAYTFRLYDTLLICAAMISDADINLVQYAIPPFSSLKMRYAVRDGTPGGTLYEGNVTFANRVQVK